VQGWHAPTISPYRNLSLDPACSVFHYGLGAFEGMKAYRDSRGRVRLFRPELNMARMGRSMARLALGPALDEAGYLACLARFAAVEKGWIPEGDGYSLYLRPTVIGTQPTLGVGPSRSLKLFTIATPVGPYFPEGFKPLSIYAESAAVRAWPGGCGDTKLGGNYAPTILVQRAAAAKGYAQVLWLFGPNLNVTEVGTMNLFVLWRRPGDGALELLTAPLDGTILPGVTRDSIISLARGWGEFAVTERAFTMHELKEALEAGRVVEMFGAGTAAVVSPIKGVHFLGKDYAVPLDPGNASAGAGKATQRFWKELLDIQYGRKEHPWSVVVG
jgi:branched-chain amino acid aminotransferase